jgi:nucleolar complex protein 3
VNIDFFQDLMQVLKDLISRESEGKEEEEGEEEGRGAEVETDVLEQRTQDGREVQHPLLCIMTAFELLTGQGQEPSLLFLIKGVVSHSFGLSLPLSGEALNIDLTDFITRLYGIILPLSLMSSIEAPLPNVLDNTAGDPKTVADLLFRALNIAFSPRAFGSSAPPPPWRSAAFAKRLLIASMHWPARTALRALEFVSGLVQRDAKLDALLRPEDRSHDGIYRPDIDDPQLCYPFGTTFWELHVLGQSHMDDRVREEAGKLATFTRS